MKKLLKSLMMFLILIPSKALLRSLLDFFAPMIVSSIASRYVYASEPKSVSPKKTAHLVTQLIVSGIAILVCVKAIKVLIKRIQNRKQHEADESEDIIGALLPVDHSYAGHARDIYIHFEDNPSQTHISVNFDPE